MSEVNSLYDFLTIPQHCAFCRSVSRQWDQGMVDHYVSLFGLPANRKVSTFSKGMKSQLALSLLMGSNPDLPDCVPGASGIGNALVSQASVLAGLCVIHAHNPNSVEI